MSTDPLENKPEAALTSAAPTDRKEAFRILVQLQDLGETVEASCARVTAQFRITQDELWDIEREGIAGNWPPL